MPKVALSEKERIIDAAIDLFARKGYAASSARDIARAVNVSVATIYYYFKGKEDLLFSIVESCGNDLLAALNTAVRESDDAEERLRSMLFRHVCLTHEKNKKVKIFVEQQNQLSRKFRSIIHKQHRQIYEVYVGELRTLQERNLLRGDSVPVATFAIFGMVNWCYRWYREGAGSSISHVARQLVDLFCHGFVKREPCSKA